MYKIIISSIICFFIGAVMGGVGLYVYSSRSLPTITNRVSEIENNNTELRDINNQLTRENERLRTELQQLDINIRQLQAIINQIRAQNRIAKDTINRIESLFDFYTATE